SNTRHGISVSQQSNARLESGTAISGNADDGLHVRDNSSIVVPNPSVTGNRGDGMDVDDGSANVSNSTITGQGTDIRATFGARLTLNNNTIGRIVCPDGTVLFRGLSVCL